MCGLVAYYKMSNGTLNPRLIEDMSSLMSHRGPDDYGYCFIGDTGVIRWRDESRPEAMSGKGVALAHRRMSIFDLSIAGRQPFVSDDGRIALVFNGEIYNFIELREELVKLGYTFTTECDTEVVLRAYEIWGVDCFNRLNGVWAIVIWDGRTNELIAVRDRLGEKPMFYAEVGDDWIFTSEIKPLFLHPAIRRAPNQRALARFLTLSGPPVGEETFYEGIKALEGGTYLRFRDGRVTKTRYWSLDTNSYPQRTDVSALKEELNALITDAVRLRMRGDLRVGSMLSGGVDSTSITTSITQVLAARHRESRAIGDRLQAFTASFAGMPIDETAKVEEFCRGIEVQIGKIFPGELDHIEDRLARTARYLEAPFWSPVVIVHDALMKFIRTEGVQVVLDGLGADEIFGGYDWYLTSVVKDQIQRGNWRKAWRNFSALRTRHARNPLKEALRVMLPSGFPTLLDSLRARMGGQGPYWYSGLLRDESLLAGLERPLQRGGSRLERELKDALLGYNVPRWCHMSDNISMSNNVVCRSPFLDYRIVDFAFSIDEDLKIRDGVPKWLLRETKRDQLPASIVNDVKKVQFSGPGDLWLQGELKPYAQSLGANADTRLHQYLHPTAIKRVVDDYYGGRQSSFPVWRMVHTEAWLREFFG